MYLTENDFPQKTYSKRIQNTYYPSNQREELEGNNIKNNIRYARNISSEISNNI